MPSSSSHENLVRERGCLSMGLIEVHIAEAMWAFSGPAPGTVVCMDGARRAGGARGRGEAPDA